MGGTHPGAARFFLKKKKNKFLFDINHILSYNKYKLTKEKEMKKFKVIGKTFTKFYGYLASHYEDVFEAKNKQEAIAKAREAFGGTTNRFIATEVK